MKRMFTLLLMTAAAGAIAFARGGPPAPNSFYVDDEVYRTIGTPTHLPNHGPKDGIFAFMGLDGQINVAEAKPGDRDYNGGRWQVVMVEYTAQGLMAFDPDGDEQANFVLTNWEAVLEQIVLGNLAVVGDGPSFVCPVIKQKD